MKKLILLSTLLICGFGFCQGEQLYADGETVDQDGNTFEWISYGIYDWAIDNAENITYRDGTPIPQVTNANQWISRNTGAWCYYNNDPTEGRLYNWYAIAGIHDEDETTPNKEFAPDGWRVPSVDEWNNLQDFLIDNGYNCDGSTAGNKIAKAMASITAWRYGSSVNTGDPGFYLPTNNSSGFNAFPQGSRKQFVGNGSFYGRGYDAIFWTSTPYNNTNFAYTRSVYNDLDGLSSGSHIVKVRGFSVRLIRDAQTASIGDNSIYNFTIYPNPAKNYLNIDCSSIESVLVYNILGKELIKNNSNRINVSSLPKGVYFIKVSDGMNTSTKKFIKN
ncbi:MAG: FISUMP domain-containing protein [Flavobacteriaceae bacterium]